MYLRGPQSHGTPTLHLGIPNWVGLPSWESHCEWESQVGFPNWVGLPSWESHCEWESQVGFPKWVGLLNWESQTELPMTHPLHIRKVLFRKSCPLFPKFTKKSWKMLKIFIVALLEQGTPFCGPVIAPWEIFVSWHIIHIPNSRDGHAIKIVN